jgi:hypothetical protein
MEKELDIVKTRLEKWKGNSETKNSPKEKPKHEDARKSGSGPQGPDNRKDLLKETVTNAWQGPKSDWQTVGKGGKIVKNTNTNTNLTSNPLRDLSNNSNQTKPTEQPTNNIQAH